METWKKYLEGSGADLWTVCERALTLAFMEEPQNFWIRRDALARKLFAPEKLDVEALQQDAPLLTPNPPAEQRIAASGAYDEAKALTEEMEDEILVKRSVLSIKEALQDSYLSKKEILDSLQRLDLMQLSVDVLKDTEIGKTVNNLRKNPSKQIRSLAKELVHGWKDLVEEWMKSAQDIAAAAATSEMPVSASQDNMNEEHGLPSPPMDEGALLASRTVSVEISQLFDFMEGDTSAGSGGSNNPEDDHQNFAITDKTVPNTSHNLPRINTVSKPPRKEGNSNSRDNRTCTDLEKIMTKKQRSITISNSHLNKADAYSNKNTCNTNSQRKTTLANERRPQTGRVEKSSVQNQSTHVLNSSSMPAHCDDADYDEKVKATKRKLQKIYEQAENEKKQRTIQVMELQNLPKGGPNRARPSYQAHNKHGSQHRPLVTNRK